MNWSRPYNVVEAAQLASRSRRARLSPLTRSHGDATFRIYELDHALVIGQSYPVSLYEEADEFHILEESSDYPGWGERWWLDHPKPQDDSVERTTLEKACVLALPHNFGHWHQETLPKIALMELAGYDGPYVVADYPLFIESLALFGIPPERIVRMPSQGLTVDRLFVPQQLNLHIVFRFPESVHDLRHRFLHRVAPVSSGNRLYIARKPQSPRAVVNDQELSHLLSQHGFRKVYMEDHSLAEQIEIAAAASTIIGPHGAGMAATTFMKPGGTVIEMFSPAYVNTCLVSTARILDLDLRTVVSGVNPPNTYKHGESIAADINLIDFHLSSMSSTVARNRQRNEVMAGSNNDSTQLTADDAEKLLFGKWIDSYNIDKVSWLRAAISSSTYAERHMRKAVRCESKYHLLNVCLEAAPRDGMLLEFGVHSGGTIGHIARGRPDQMVYGFDSFEGLPEDWRPGFGKGAFALPELPDVPENVKLIKGWFNQTLPQFALDNAAQKIALLHVDCDLYSSTVTIFAELRRMIVPGTIILFDEFFNYPEWELHEAKAYEEFCSSNNIAGEFIGLVAHHQQAAVRVLG